MRLFLQGKKTVEDKEIGRLFLNKKGIIWDRNYGSKNPRCENIEEISKLLNVGHMIVGHTVQKGINSRCDNKLWRVDVGISDSFSGNKIEVLEILDNGVPTEKNKKKPFRIIKI